FPCTTLAIGAVRITPGRFRHAEEVANLAAVAKHEAKQAVTGVVQHGGFAESGLGAVAAARVLQDVLAA
ncbi:MAG TPA: diguanylate phosphodiesterase, partial [Acidovorax sp.]|nr:diguanylate phosphodiesterase [Acidovorax sp.]